MASASDLGEVTPAAGLVSRVGRPCPMVTIARDVR